MKGQDQAKGERGGTDRHCNLKRRSFDHLQREGQVTTERNKVPCQKDVTGMSNGRAGGRRGKQRHDHKALRLVSGRGRKAEFRQGLSSVS